MTCISIILVNYNGVDFLYDCLYSIKQFVEDSNYEVIIIDNASSDNSIKVIEDNFPLFRLICSPNNLGFGKANNLAVKYSRGEHLLFLNTDTILTENTPKILLDYLRKHEDIGAIGGRLTFKDGSFQLSYGKLPNLLVEFFYKIRVALDNKWHQIFSDFYDKKYSRVKTVDWITGACLMIRRDVFQDLNGFDESFFMYFEDIDICKRINESGFKVLYYPETTLIHLLGGSGRSMKKGINTYYRESQLHYYQKHLGQFQTKVLKLYLRFSGRI